MRATSPSQPSLKPSAQNRARVHTSKSTKKQDTIRRATVSLSADSSEIVERYKAATGLSTSRAIEELILHSEPRPPQIKMVDGLAIFDFPVKGGRLTLEDIRRLEDEPW